MSDFRTSKESLEKCKIKGQILTIEEFDVDHIKSLVELSDGDIKAGEKLMKGLNDNNILWNNVYNSYYDAIHKLVDAYLRFDKISSINHLCLFVYLCEKHPELELDWNFFEKIRTKRNGINYYGTSVSYKDLKEIELQIKLYIKTLKKAIEKKLK